MTQDKKVIDELKKQMKAEKEYNNKFLDARREVKRREMERETAYQKFKRHQDKERESNEILEKFLAKKDQS